MPEKKKAVALRYSEDLPAPFVIAKGRDEMAKRLLDIAAEFDIPLHSEDKLANLLFTLEIGEMIPDDLYEIIALILSQVYRIQERL